ncbi:hypothetical protein N7528_001193 [Penicillium herquei]|nr:hypothetical protein N7528_001193 [Penicillium herquei]
MTDERPQTSKRKEKQKQKFKISEEQARRIVKCTLQYVDHGLGGFKACVRKIGNALYHDLEPKHESKNSLSSPLGGRYGSKLCDRNEELERAVEKAQELAQLRGKAATADFKTRLAECIKKYNIQPDDIYAVKEYGFITRKTSSRQKMTLRRPPNPQNDARSLASTILCVNNKGEFLTPYLITKGQKSSHFMSCAGVMLGSNPDAWADAYDFERWLEFFHSETRSSTAFRLRPWRLILVESHSSPISEKCFVMAIEERIIWFSYPKHKPDHIDPYSCGVLHYFDRRYAEWPTGRWETKEANGEEMSQGMEIKTNHLGPALKWFTTDIEREVELRKAWKKAEQAWSLTKVPNDSDAITIPVGSGEEWDGEDEYGFEEFGDQLQVKHEGSSSNPSTGANMVLRLQTLAELEFDLRTSRERLNHKLSPCRKLNHSSQIPLGRNLHRNLDLPPSRELLLGHKFNLRGQFHLGRDLLLGDKVHLGLKPPPSPKLLLNHEVSLSNQPRLGHNLPLGGEVHLDLELHPGLKLLPSHVFNLSSDFRLSREQALKLKPPLYRVFHISHESALGNDIPLSRKANLSSDRRLHQPSPLNRELQLIEVIHIGRGTFIRHQLLIKIKTNKFLEEGQTVGDLLEDEEEKIEGEVMISSRGKKDLQEAGMTLWNQLLCPLPVYATRHL